jgi:hypothetical protein
LIDRQVFCWHASFHFLNRSMTHRKLLCRGL